jgi:hypothetical protein
MIYLLLGMLFVWTPAYAAVVFEDDFEYEVNRNATNAQVPFEAAGWADVKATNTNYGGFGGYLYTVDDATLGSKVLVMESLPTTVGGQTDYWLKLAGDEGYIPADVWLQFWTYATPGSLFHRMKLLYPCHQSLPCPGESFTWLLGVIGSNNLPGTGTAPDGGRFFRISGSTVNNTAVDPSDAQKLYQNLSATPMLEGTWYLVKIHLNTSGAQGTYESWMREHGVASFTKLAEWIGGVTPNFDWPIPVERRVGNLVFSMPTTVDTLDGTTYMDDFIIATSESDLPTYTNAPSVTISGGTTLSGSVRIQ